MILFLNVKMKKSERSSFSVSELVGLYLMHKNKDMAERICILKMVGVREDYTLL